MNIGALGAASAYGMADYSVAGRKNSIWNQQKENFVQNEKVQEDFQEKIKNREKTSQRAEQIANQKMNGEKLGKWYLLADDDGLVSYNGVTFVLNSENQQLCLGDMDEKDNILTIPLSRGGTLKVNRDNIDDLGRAIGMFSPEDINRILRAISEDAQCRRKLNEIEEDKNSIGEEDTSTEDMEEKQEPVSTGVAGFYDSDNYKRAWEDYFKGVDNDVQQIWKETMEETGIDGFGYNSKGMLTHITQFQIAQITTGRQGQSVLGTTVQSALEFAEAALYSLQNPLMPLSSHPQAVQSDIMNEQRFYERLVERLRMV